MSSGPDNGIWKKMAEAALDLLCTFNHNGHFIQVNNASKSILGYSPQELADQPYALFLHPDYLARTRHAFEQAQQGHACRNLETCFMHKNGQQVMLQLSAVWQQEDQMLYVIGRDIRPMASREATQHAPAKRHPIFESITDALLTIDKNWVLTYINSKAESLLSLDRNAHIGKNVWQLFPAEVGGESYTQYCHALDTGNPVDFITFFEQADLWLQVKAFPTSEGLSIYFTDVTELVKSRQKLEMLSLVASKTTNSVLIADKHWKIEWINEGFTKLFGYKSEEVIGKLPSELLHSPNSDKTTYDSLEPRLLQGEPISFEVLNVKKSGEELWVSVEINAVFDEAGQLTRFIEVQTDITALKNSQLELASLAADLYKHNSDLQQFSYIVSHNLRGPVANALGLAELLPKIPRESDLFELSLSNLKQSVFRLDNVLKDITTILNARDSKGNLELEPVNLKSVMQQALSSLQEPLQDCKGQVSDNISETLQVRANKAYLYSVFYNLLSNAIKYKSQERPLQVHIRCYDQAAQGVLLSFSDNGSGFDMEKAKDSIFKLYKRFHANKPGRGIGLYLVKSHLEAMNGHIEVTSKPGRGTRFLIFLPKQ